MSEEEHEGEDAARRCCWLAMSIVALFAELQSPPMSWMLSHEPPMVGKLRSRV
jgi:hypothetical protein